MKPLVIIAHLLAIATFASSAPTITDSEAPDYRLPDNILPSHYEVRLEPFLLESDSRRFTFDGTVFITLSTMLRNQKKITLHAAKMNITTWSIYEKLNESMVKEIVNMTKPDPITDKFDVNLAEELTTNLDYVLKFTFNGELGDDMHGFYKSKYVRENGQEVWIGSTQFQTNHARRAFPCFDEPKFKATFEIEITHPDIFSVVSNTEIYRIYSISAIKKSVTKFRKTPKMSSYLVAFIVSDFKHRGGGSFSVLARPEAYDQTQYAYEIGPKLLRSLDVFTDYAYSRHGLGKMDLAGIPDFSAGAMENWGLLTYRETALLYDSRVSTLLNQQRVATVISHELAHQWFGDLVTCEWWGYTWLNEAFGRYFQYFTTHEVESSWELDKQFVVDQLQTVMNMDSLPGSTPMSDPTAASPADLSRMFNSISYNKGATFLRMVKHMMGEDRFKTALRTYLKNKAFQSAVPQDLFREFMSQWSGEVDTNQLLRDWTEQVGYPVVTIELASDGTAFRVRQNSFLLQENANDNSTLWNIPFTYTTDAELDFENTRPKLFLEKSSNVRMVNLTKQAKWIIGNIQETGYYRVNYDQNTWKNIRQALGIANFSGIHELNRAQIVDDVFNLARASLITYNDAINILSYLKNEVHYLPWTSAFSGYTYLAVRLGPANVKLFANYILPLLTKAYESVGFKFTSTEKRLITYNRANVLSWACKYEMENCVNQSAQIFNDFMNSNATVEVNIRPVVYCTAIRQGNATTFEFLWEKFRTENVATEQVLILTALGCTGDKQQLHKYLDRILSNDVRLQDKSSAFQGTFTSYAANVELVWEYVENNFEKMIKSFDSNSTAASIISTIASRFTTSVQRNSLQTFITKNSNSFGSSISTLEKAVESVDYNLNWSEKSLKPFVEHLKSLNGGPASVSISAALVLAVSYFVAFFLS